jgi:2,3-bisphosphoglycerate-dependent phosphoglycerate mutase
MTPGICLGTTRTSNWRCRGNPHVEVVGRPGITFTLAPTGLFGVNMRHMRMDRTEIVLVRHAQSMPSKEIPEADWPLSPLGIWQAQQLAHTLKRWKIDAIFSSPYARAKATVEPYARVAGLRVRVTMALRERKLTEESRDDWLALLQTSWADFSFTLPRCESSADCQRRMHAGLAKLAASHRGQTLLVCSHGNAIALFLHGIDDSFGFEAWAARRNPELFRITYDVERPFWHKSFTLHVDTEQVDALGGYSASVLSPPVIHRARGDTY